MYNRRRVYDYDRIFPLRSKFVERPDMLGHEVAEEDKYNGLDPQVELIARVSYRLGHAEGNANNFAHQLEDTEGKLEAKTTELKKANAKIEKMKPKKPTARKVAKNGRKAQR